MQHNSASLEIIRWGYAHLPGAVFYYAKELDLDMEDIGILSTFFYAFENTKPLFQSGIRMGQILQCCSTLSTRKLSHKINKLVKQELIQIAEGDSKAFTDKVILLEPLMDKLEQLVIRDHPRIINEQNSLQYTNQNLFENQIEEYQKKLEELEAELEEEKNRRVLPDFIGFTNQEYKRVADFIAKKTGNLLSVKMENELKKWLEEMAFTPEFLLCMLELSFERKIINPRDISKIARDLKEYSISTVEGLQMYFNNHVDLEKNRSLRINQFDPDIAEFGTFTGIDMNAEARKKTYYKWRYDWGFAHPMIMKAGEVMCQYTKNGGLEYIDSVLNNWMSKEIRSISEAEKEISNFKNKNKNSKSGAAQSTKPSGSHNKEEYEFYVPPEVLEELKSNV